MRGFINSMHKPFMPNARKRNMMIEKGKHIIALLGFIVLSFSIHGQQTSLPWEKLSGLPYQQKVYLHLDKEEYFAGDILWFKAYIADATSHQPDTAENTLFVELYNTNGELYMRRIVFVENGYGSGNIYLNDSIIAGNYYIRAYTEWNLQLDERFIFEKFLPIINPLEPELLSRSDARQNRKINRDIDRKKENATIAFFPESGQIIENLQNTIAFRAENELGQGIDIHANLIGPEGIIIPDIETAINGKGSFSFTPKPGENYFFEATLPNGETKNIELSDIAESGYLIQVDATPESTSLFVNKRFPEPENRKAWLAIHQRGRLLKIIQISSNEFPFRITFKNSDFSRGIVAATLFDETYQITAERLFFVQPTTPNMVDFSLTPGTDKYYNLDIQLIGSPADSSAYSVSIKAWNKKPVKSPSHMYYHFYLVSDLLLPLQEPETYFDQPQNNKHIDLLMLASKWERINWEDIDSLYQLSTTPYIGQGFPFFGIVTPRERSQALDKTQFNLGISIEEGEYVGRTLTNPDGSFMFRGIEQFGSFNARLELSGVDGSSAERLELFPARLKKEKQSLNVFSRKLEERSSFSWRRRSPVRAVPSQRITEIREQNRRSGYGSPDQVIHIRDNHVTYRTMREVLQRNVPGLQIDGNRLTLRGKTSFYFSSDPLILVDGAQYTSQQFLQILPNELDFIEIYKGPSSSVYGIRGTNGVINAYSRRGSTAERIIFNYVINGYHIPQPFNGEKTQLSEKLFNHPEYSQTIYWLNHVKFNPSGQASLRIPANALPAYISVTLEGLTPEGTIISGQDYFNMHRKQK